MHDALNGEVHGNVSHDHKLWVEIINKRNLWRSLDSRIGEKLAELVELYLTFYSLGQNID